MTTAPYPPAMRIAPAPDEVEEVRVDLGTVEQAGNSLPVFILNALSQNEDMCANCVKIADTLATHDKIMPI